MGRALPSDSVEFPDNFARENLSKLGEVHSAKLHKTDRI